MGFEQEVTEGTEVRDGEKTESGKLKWGWTGRERKAES